MYIYTNIVEKGKIKVEHVPGANQMVSILTKQLLGEAFRKHARAIGLDIHGS
jgi:hypothetical protein